MLGDLKVLRAAARKEGGGGDKVIGGGTDRVRAKQWLPANARLCSGEDGQREVLRRLEEQNGISSNTASDRLHQIKDADGFGGADNVSMPQAVFLIRMRAKLWEV